MPGDDAPAPVHDARDAVLAACLAMERRISALQSPEAEEGVSVTDEIHQTRKAGKQLRGALAMLDEPKPCIRWIAVIGRLLGGQRDATVRWKTWQSLPASADAPAGSAVAAAASLLRAEACASAGPPPAEILAWSLSALGQVRARLEARTSQSLAAEAETGETKLRRRVRKRLKRATDDARDEDFHECRKIVKAWLGGRALLFPGEPAPGQETAKALAAKLGEEHDLDVLAAWLDEHGLGRSLMPELWRQLHKRQEKARRRSLSIIRQELLPELSGQR